MQRYYSNIYWHFTGSPDVDWSAVTIPAEIKGKAKLPEESKNTLLKIISSLTCRVSRENLWKCKNRELLLCL